MPEWELDVSAVEEDYESTQWLWRNRIPAHKVTLVSGDWGAGKTHAIANVITCVLRREEFPDGELPEQDPGNVVIMTTESSLSELHQVFAAQGCDKHDLERIKVTGLLVNGDGRKYNFDIDKNLPALEDLLKRLKPVILWFDPLVEFHSRREIDSHAIRGLMTLLNELAQKYRVAILCNIHWNKNEKLGRRNRTAGSHQYQAGVKAVITIERVKEGLRDFNQDKMNLGPEPISLSFKIEPPDGLVIWSKNENYGRGDTKLAEAERWLVSQVTNGPVEIQTLYKNSESLFSDRTLRRARNNLSHDIITREYYDKVQDRVVSTWDLACERNLWGLGKISLQAPSG